MNNNHHPELALGDGPGVQVPFLVSISRLFGEDAEPSGLFKAVSERLAEQSANGELARLTAHEERWGSFSD
jgi:hypothetical protein